MGHADVSVLLNQSPGCLANGTRRSRYNFLRLPEGPCKDPGHDVEKNSTANHGRSTEKGLRSDCLT